MMRYHALGWQRSSKFNIAVRRKQILSCNGTSVVDYEYYLSSLKCTYSLTQLFLQINMYKVIYIQEYYLNICYNSKKKENNCALIQIWLNYFVLCVQWNAMKPSKVIKQDLQDLKQNFHIDHSCLYFSPNLSAPGPERLEERSLPMLQGLWTFPAVEIANQQRGRLQLASALGGQTLQLLSSSPSWSWAPSSQLSGKCANAVRFL